ncbi:MAG: DHHA1 domain-containing protein [Candidatus Aenigmatarchaeota archaeon]
MKWNKHKKYLEDLEDPIVIYHRDADGVCSGAMMADFLGTSICLPNDGDGIQVTGELIDIINDHGSAVFVDLPVDQLDIMEKLEVDRIFILDHHPPVENLTDDGVLHVNPRFEDDKVYLPAAYLSQRIVGDEVPGSLWKAGVGVIGDHGVEDCRDLMDEIDERYPEILPQKKYSMEELNESKLGIISQMIDSSKVMKGLQGIKHSLDVVKNAKEPNELLRSRLSNWYDRYKILLESEKDMFEENSKYFPKTDSYLYELDTDYSLTSTLSTSLADDHPDSVIITYKRNGGMNLSGRCQSGRVDVSEILKRAVGDRGNAGGHPQAAGGHVRKGNEETVLEKLKEILEGISDLTADE